MATGIKIEGMQELTTKLRVLEGVFADERVEKILMEQGANPLRDETRWNAPRLTGALARSIISKIGKRFHNSPSALTCIDFKLLNKPGVEEGSRYPYVVEFGTPAHEILPKPPNKHLKLFGRVFVSKVEHPGSEPRSFFRRALTAMRPKIKQNIETELKRVVDNVASGSYGAGTVAWGAGASSIFGDGGE